MFTMRSTAVAAYVISELEVLDHEAIDTYRRLAADSIERYGGRYLVRGGPSELVEGQPPPKILVIVEFPTMENCEGMVPFFSVWCGP
jgi:uncharacterized protein (DUF1330 family)